MFTHVANMSEIPDGRSKVFSVNGRAIAVFNLKGKYHAILDACPHNGDALTEGDLDETLISCPCHGFQFDVVSGICATDPFSRATTYEVKLEGDKVLLKVE